LTNLGVIIFAIVTYIVGLFFGIMLGDFAINSYQEDTLGGDVLNYVCDTKGCSYLIEHKNGTVTWEYAPKLIND